MAARSQQPGWSDGPHNSALAEAANSRGRTRNVAVVTILAVCVIAWLVCYIPRRTSVNFLSARQPASWITYPTPANADALPAIEMTTEFRRTFLLSAPIPHATLSARGFKRIVVWLNGKQLAPQLKDAGNWNSIVEFAVAKLLRPGTNELSVCVSSTNGLPAAWVCLQAGGFELVSDASWTASFAGGRWQNAQLASAPPKIRPGSRLCCNERPLASLREQWRIFLLLSALAALILILGHKLVAPSKSRLVCLAVLALALTVLWINNLGQLPRQIGFDATEHLAYVQYIIDHASLPLANEGWEMYQPPLYYLISAGLLRLVHLSTADADGVVVLRIFGLICGITTFLLVFLSLRLLFPARSAAQIMGLVFAALLPVNLYLFQYVTNELLASTLVAAAIYLSLRMVSLNGTASLWRHASLGFVLGAALLTKSSALLAAAMVFVALAWHHWKSDPRPLQRWILHLGVLLLVCIAVCGWHYYRTAVHFGNPLLGNWNARSGFNWWQQPGYRTASAFGHFGQCLRQPFYSAFAGVPDGLYSTLWGDGLFGGEADWRGRPPWNYHLMSAGYLFALVPTIAVIIGFLVYVHSFWQQPTSGTLLLLGVAVFAFVALAYYTLTVPSYATGKAFYVLPALVPLCVFAATGLEFLAGKMGNYRFLIFFVFTLWGINAFASFWIWREAPETKILMARTLAAENQPDAAAGEVELLLDRDPRNAAALQLQAMECAKSNHIAEAASLARQAIESSPADADAHLLLGTILFQEGKVDQAIAEAQRTIQLAPDHPKAASSLFAWLYRLGRKEEAAAACAESLRVDPFNPQFHLGMARVLVDLGDGTNAAFHAQIAEQLKRNQVKH